MAESRTRVSSALMTGSLAPFADAYRVELVERGYAPLSVVNQLRQVGRFSRWLEAGGFGVAEVSALDFLIQARMASGCDVPLTHFEAPAVLHYETGEQITPHFDFIDPRSPDYEKQVQVQGQRIFTFLIYLNDGYEGGETAFPELGFQHRGARREGLLFSNVDAHGNPDLRMLHAGQAPTRGEKWILSQFIRRRPVR